MSNRFQNELQAFEALLADKSPIDLVLPTDDLFLLMCSLQFAASDPRLIAPTRAQMTRIGRELSRYVILKYPHLKDDIDKGWEVV